MSRPAKRQKPAESARQAEAARREGPGNELKDLLERFRCGEVDAFEDIVGRYQTRLVQFFYRLSWDRDQAEDLTQGLFIKLLRGADRYRPQGRLSTFIFKVATNLWIDHYRSRRSRQPLYSLDQALLAGFDPAAEGGVMPSDQAEMNEEREQLRQSLEQLTEPHRLVFELAVYQQLPYAQIGEVLEIPIGTVKSRMHNSVRALKKILDPGGQGWQAADQGIGRRHSGAGG